MPKKYFNAGCALHIYKPEAEKKILDFLNQNYAEVQLHAICCRHNPQLEAGSLIINLCAGCDRRFSNLYPGISTISLWKILDNSPAFSFPDYHGLKLSVHDACPVREKPQVHQAVRNLLKKMKIEVVETEFSGTRSICCGDSFFPQLSVEQVGRKMKERADSMPCDEVCVYCVSCIKSIYIGGKSPRYLVDLLFGETTEPQIYDTVNWHEQLQATIDQR